MQIRAFKYLSPAIVYLLAYISFTSNGVLTWLPLIYAWALLPMIELFIKPDEKNLDAAEEEIARHNKLYDYLLYLIVVLQYGALVFFLYSMQISSLSWIEITGRILSMGLLCGTFGINVGHELGHRKDKFEQTLAKMLLATSLYMHFFIEHNKGHHKNVATHEDPSSARYNEPIYIFYFRTIIFSYISAWRIAVNDCKKSGVAVIGFKNEMVQAHLFQITMLTLIYLVFGGMILIYFLLAAAVGIGLLETVNYIEHYGLKRKQTAEGSYERTMPYHSWNSNHPLGRVMLFELSRHSDHHYMASRKYQVLRYQPGSPQLPTGYPGSMILALIPPLWFYVMNRKIKKLNRN